MKQIPDRCLAVLRTLEAGNVNVRRVVNGFDCPFRDGNAKQRCSDRLRHGLGNEPVAISASILIMLEEYLIILDDEQSRDGIARQIFYWRRLIASIRIADVRLRTLESRRYGGTPDPSRRKDLIEVAIGTDAIFKLVRVAGLPCQGGIGNRIALCGTIAPGFWARSGKDRTRTVCCRRRILDRGRDGGRTSSGRGKPRDRCTARKNLPRASPDQAARTASVGSRSAPYCLPRM